MNWRKRREDDLDRELRAHLDLEAEEQGDAAKARRALGNATLIKEDVRRTWRFASIESIVQDVRYGLRLMRRSPGFTAVAVLSLALGIGANTAIFSLIDAVALRTLPVAEPERLYTLHPAGKDGNGAFSYSGFETLREQSREFADTFTYEAGGQWNIVVNGRAEVRRGASVSDNFFTALGVRATAGRVFGPGEKQAIAVISHRYWKSQFALDPAAVGSPITINGEPFTIAGIAPPDFFGVEVGASPDLYFPMSMQPGTNQGRSLLADTSWWLGAMTRLKPGVTEQQARARFAALLPAVQRTMGVEPAAHPDMFSRFEIAEAARGSSPLRSQFSAALRILMAIAGMALLLACANLANLLLSRATARRREFAVRLSVGGGRGRLIRQLATESLVLAAAGGLAGLVFARWSASVLVAFLGTGRAPVILDLPLDVRTLGFAALATVVTAVLFGVAPALRATRLDAGPVLKETARTVSGGQPISRALVAAQVAISLVLVSGAGLFVRSLENLRTMDLGFRPENLLVMTVEPALAGYKDARLLALYNEILDRAQNLPGVRSATLARFGLIGAGFGGRQASVPGFVAREQAESIVAYNAVGPQFFQTAGIPILAGRDFSAADMTSPRAAIVNERFARLYFGGANALGRQFTLRGAKEPLEIVGVAGDSKFFRIREESPRTVFTPYTQSRGVGLDRMFVHICTAADPERVAAAAQQEIRAVAPGVPIASIQTQRAQIDAVLVRERLLAVISGFFGAAALLLASIGLYGVLSYTVARRTAEIGVRIALGARRSDVVRMVLRDTTLLVGVGLAAGVPAVLASARLIEAQLYAVKPNDPLTLVFAGAILAGAAALASGLPAWRAARIDPISAMRYE